MYTLFCIDYYCLDSGAASMSLLVCLFDVCVLPSQHTRMERPSFPEGPPTSNQTSCIPPHKGRTGHPAQPYPNWVPKRSPEIHPTTSPTKGTWTFSTCLTRACLGKTREKRRRERGLSGLVLIASLRAWC